MKMKSFAMLAVSGLLAASIYYAVPALAEEAAINSDPSVTPNELNNTENRDATALSANNSSNSMNAGGSNTTDEGGPDTVSGDDDY